MSSWETFSGCFPVTLTLASNINQQVSEILIKRKLCACLKTHLKHREKHGGPPQWKALGWPDEPPRRSWPPLSAALARRGPGSPMPPRSPRSTPGPIHCGGHCRGHSVQGPGERAGLADVRGAGGAATAQTRSAAHQGAGERETPTAGWDLPASKPCSPRPQPSLCRDQRSSVTTWRRTAVSEAQSLPSMTRRAGDPRSLPSTTWPAGNPRSLPSTTHRAGNPGVSPDAQL